MDIVSARTSIVDGIQSLGLDLNLAGVDWDLLGSYAGLLSLAVFSIYAGSFGSLPRVKRRKAGEEKGEEKEGEDEDEDEEDEEDGERMSSEDAWIFPIVGSIALVGLYVIVKYLGKEWINWLLGWYFAIAGVGSVWNSSISLTRYLVGEGRWKKFDKVRVSVKKGAHEYIGISTRTPSVWLGALAVVPSGVYMWYGRSAVVTDVLGLSFAHNALSLLRIDSFKTGCILLSGLFVYDVWWVFGTEVMVEVATKLDVPIKLLWRKAEGHTMLGLGDVVIPGTFIALALRYDASRGKRSGGAYFYGGLGAYVTGLVTTMTVMNVSGSPQPALLYLSPALIISFVVTGVVRGEMAEAWAWVDK